MAKAKAKVATIASLVRIAARNEADFVASTLQVFAEEKPARTAEFFDRLNIPRSQGGEGLLEPLPTLEGDGIGTVYSFDDERKLATGIQRFLDRHERKIRWHAAHPSSEGVQNVLLLFRAAMMVTQLRVRRLHLLLGSTDELTSDEWWIARELMNGTYQSFRKFLSYVAGDWVDALNQTVDRDELTESIGMFYEFVDQQVRDLEEAREKIEERRAELTVNPEGHPPVKPPIYFGGDVLGRGPWKQYWQALNARAHHFRESVG